MSVRANYHVRRAGTRRSDYVERSTAGAEAVVALDAGIEVLDRDRHDAVLVERVLLLDARSPAASEKEISSSGRSVKTESSPGPRWREAFDGWVRLG